MWFKLDDNGDPVRLPDGATPTAADQFCIKTKVRKYEISTVFLGLDHGINGPPVLFETMVFGGDDKYENLQVRYYTKKEAIKGHEYIVKKVEGLSGLLKKL